MDLTMFGSPIDFLEEYHGSVAINIKVRTAATLSDETLVKLGALNKRTREQVIHYAEEGLRDNWLATMQDYARARGLGDLSAMGRSGGWLVLQMTRSKFEEMVEYIETNHPCIHCKECWRKHIDGKCAFDSSTFEPDPKADDPSLDGSLGHFEDLHAFADEVKEALKNVVGDLDAEVRFQLENLDDAYAADVPSGTPSDDSGDEAEETDP